MEIDSFLLPGTECSHNEKDSNLFVINYDGFSVCSQCGFVKEEMFNILESLYLHSNCEPGYITRAKLVYKATFHLHEREAQLCCKDPPIPEMYMDRIKETWSTCDRTEYSSLLTRTEIGKLLQSIEGTVLDSQGKERDAGEFIYRTYHERWICIRYILSGCRLKPPRLTGMMIMEIEKRFLNVLNNWNKVRHSKQCDRVHGKHKVETDCHLKYGCRHNLPNYNFMLVQFLWDIYYTTDVKERENIPGLTRYLKKVKTLQRRKKLEYYWKRLKKYTNLPLYS